LLHVGRLVDRDETELHRGGKLGSALAD